VNYLPRIVHFELNVKDVEKTIKFYEEVFGWKFEKWSGPIDYWLIMTGDENEPGIDGGLENEE
jgi:predicted enzyme related to lactoylglutathione lyase